MHDPRHFIRKILYFDERIISCYQSVPQRQARCRGYDSRIPADQTVHDTTFAVDSHIVEKYGMFDLRVRDFSPIADRCIRTDVAVLDLDPTFADRLDLGPLERDPGLEALQKLVVVARPPIRREPSSGRLPLLAHLLAGLRRGIGPIFSHRSRLTRRLPWPGQPNEGPPPGSQPNKLEISPPVGHQCPPDAKLFF